MPRCWICDRAMVSESYLPLNICKRAKCKHEREHLKRRWLSEYSRDYFKMQRGV